MSEVITLGGGCFWCVEAVFVEMIGVNSVVSGYMGGHVENPSYEQICTGMTGHVEVIQVDFEPDVVSLEQILSVFFTVHDTTTLNSQGNDVGPQYRSAIFYHSDEQKVVAEKVMADVTSEALWPNPLVTELTSAVTFYPAEAYHQDYYARNPYQGYCMVVISPKVNKFRSKFSHLQKK